MLWLKVLLLDAITTDGDAVTSQPVVTLCDSIAGVLRKASEVCELLVLDASIPASRGDRVQKDLGLR